MPWLCRRADDGEPAGHDDQVFEVCPHISGAGRGACPGAAATSASSGIEAYGADDAGSAAATSRSAGGNGRTESGNYEASAAGPFAAQGA
jgi:hypothetical protein